MATKNRDCADTYRESILLVDDEAQTLLSFSVQLKSAGLTDVTTIEDSREVMAFLDRRPVTVVVLDLSMPFVGGRELMTRIKERHPLIPVVVMTATNDIDTAVACMRDGAVDYLVKPVEQSRFLSAVKRALEIRHLKDEVTSLKKYIFSDTLEQPETFAHIITQNKQMLSIFKYVEAISHSKYPVVITGETGVGKELLARALHMSRGGEGEFTAVNVAGLDDTMFSDTLFGHKRGAFTGADSSREGLIARSAGGTLFLDEIGDLNPQSQVKLMRLIQEKEYYALGSDMPRKTDAHIITATNRDLLQLMKGDLFRRDLYFRLCSHQIQVPPLRERKDDIPLLVNHFIHKAADALAKSPPAIPPQLNLLLGAYDFPGNIRELESLIYDAVSRRRSGTLSLDSFKRAIQIDQAELHEARPSSAAERRLESFFGRFPTMKQVEEYLVDEALERAEGNQGMAASFLGMTRQALNKRLSRRAKG